MRDLPRRVDGDVDPTALKQAHVRSVKLARFGEAFLGETPRRANLSYSRT
jgi:hypothetical protein